MDEFVLHLKTITYINYRTPIITESCRVNGNTAFLFYLTSGIKHVKCPFIFRRHFKYPSMAFLFQSRSEWVLVTDLVFV